MRSVHALALGFVTRATKHTVETRFILSHTVPVITVYSV